MIPVANRTAALNAHTKFNTCEVSERRGSGVKQQLSKHAEKQRPKS